MPVFQFYVASCDLCGKYASRPIDPRPIVDDRNGAFLSASEQNVMTNAIRKGWSAYPVLCPSCNGRVKEDTVTNKIAGLYLNLVKALNALEEAGEEVRFDGALHADGNGGAVTWDADAGRWMVAQA